MRILVVEDDSDLSRQLKDALKEVGYAVDVAADGEEGQFSRHAISGARKSLALMRVQMII